MPKNPNPLFLKWVKEFHDEKDWRKKGGPPRPSGYENAVRALEACTVKYSHPMELQKLNGIGPVCVDRLTEKLEEYCEQRGIPMPKYNPPSRKKRGSKAVPATKKEESNAGPSNSKYNAQDIYEDEDTDEEFSDFEGGVRKCPNPLFLKWVREFHDEKDWRKRGGPPRPSGYENAVRALEASTQKYTHPKELLKLTGIGPVCVERLTEKLEEYCEMRGLPMPEYQPPPRRKPGPRSKKTSRLPPGPIKVKIIEEDGTETIYPPPKPSKSKRKVSRDDDDEEAESEEEPIVQKKRKLRH